MTAATDTDCPIVDRAPRVEMQDGRRGHVVIERATDSEPKSIRGELIDISRGGAKLALDACVPFDESITLAITIPELDLEFQVLADVSWSRQAEDGKWLVGCCFDPSLPDDTVDRLAKGGYLERRRNPRYPISCQGTVHWELSAKAIPVWLEDFSADGFCMLCSKPGDTGQRFRLELGEDGGQRIVIAAKMQWQARAEDGYLVGCAFLNRHDFHRLWEIAYQTTPNQPLQPKGSLSQSRWLLAWFAALIGFIIAYPPLIRFLAHRPSVAAVAVAHRPGAEPAPHTDRAAAADQAPESVTTRTRSNPPGQAHRPAGSPATPAHGAGMLPPEIPMAADQHQSAAPGPGQSPESQPAAALSHRWQRQQLRAAETAWNSARRRQQAELAQRARALDDRAARLAAQQVAIQQERDEWSQQLQQQRAQLESQRALLLAEKAAWNGKRTLSAASAIRPPELPKVVAEPSGQRAGPGRGTPNEVGQLATDRTQQAATAAAPAPVTTAPRDRAAALAAFRQGREQFERHQPQQAIEAFQTAVHHDPANPLYCYLLAITQYQTGAHEAAEQSLRRAMELERDRPIDDWGQAMQRCQGTARLWLERSRRKALRRPT